MAEAPPVLVAGGGPVALFLALTLAERDVPFTLFTAERAAADRPIALSHGSRLLLERVGAFASLATTPIETIHVSQRGGFGRAVMSAREEGVPALGYVVSYSSLCAALRQRLTQPSLIGWISHYASSRQGDSVLARAFAGQGDWVEHETSLLVLAEGTSVRAAVPPHPGRGTLERHRDYAQSAVVARIRAEKPHGHRAWERFTPEGPLALLPDGNELSMVWSTSHEKARALCGLRDGPFLARLAENFGARLGRLLASSARSAFPVELRYRRGLPVPRVLAIGNAAQTLHPVAGQGLNLGLRDAFELAETLAEAHANGRDPGAAPLLQGYLRARQLDRGGGIHFTDALVRVFSNDRAPLGIARGAGLAALDVLPPLRRFVARRMMFGAQGL